MLKFVLYFVLLFYKTDFKKCEIKKRRKFQNSVNKYQFFRKCRLLQTKWIKKIYFFQV